MVIGKRKKFLSLFLSLVLVLSLMPAMTVTVHAGTAATFDFENSTAPEADDTGHTASATVTQTIDGETIQIVSTGGKFIIGDETAILGSDYSAFDQNVMAFDALGSAYSTTVRVSLQSGSTFNLNTFGVFDNYVYDHDPNSIVLSSNLGGSYDVGAQINYGVEDHGEAIIDVSAVEGFDNITYFEFNASGSNMQLALDNIALTNITAPLSGDATLKASSTVKGQTVNSLGTPNATLGDETAGSVTISAVKAADTSNAGSYITLFDKNESHATVKVVKYASGASAAGFSTDAAYNNEAIMDGDFFIVKVTAQDGTTVKYYRINVAVQDMLDFEAGSGTLNGFDTHTMTYVHTGTDATFTITAVTDFVFRGTAWGAPSARHGVESAYFGYNSQETEVTINVEAGKKFDLRSFYLSSQGSDTTEYSITTDNSGSYDITLTDNLFTNLVSLPDTAEFKGITWFKITPVGEGAFMELDDIVVVNVIDSAPASNHTATAGAFTLTPVVGVDDAITLTVKNSLGNIDTDFDGAKNVTIAGIEVAPDGTYGSFNGTALTSDAAGAGQVISVTFTDGVATANLKLNKADAQTIGFSIASVTIPATNTLPISPTHGTAASMAVTQNITAPASNGGPFAQQPRITIKDDFGNTCTSDNATVVTAAKEDAGTWTLTGTTTAAAVSGVASFTNLGATNTVLVSNAQLGFTATGLTGATSNTVTLPAPAGNHTATAGAFTLTPVVGVDDAITLTVKNSLGNIDTDFDGAKNVTIAGIEVAPDGTYGSFNGMALDSDAAGVGQGISVTFTDGVATPNLKLNKADVQTIEFSIASVTTPATNTLTITPSHGTAASMAVTQNLTAPASNGGQFAQQPRVTIKDAFGNECTGDNVTVVTAAKEDAGSWTLTGTTTASAISGVVTFTNLGAINAAMVNNAQLGFTAAGLTGETSNTVTLPAPAGNHTATAGAFTLTPVAGVDDQITLTVKNTLGNIDTDFDGAKNVTIAGIEMAPDGTYGSFNGMALDANSAGAGQVISVTFTNGVATANLKLNKADAQTIGFSIATVTTPATNALTITPSHGTAASMALIQNLTAPASNGGQFAQQPRVIIKDAFGNECTGDNVTVVTAAKEDAGTWTLTGTTTATAISGVVTFTNLGANNAAMVNNAQLGFTAAGLTGETSNTVTLPAPAGNHTATAGVNTLTPVAGVDDQITLTVKNTLGNTDTDFDGAKNVTIAGIEMAPDGTYGSFNGTILTADAAGAGQVISVTFVNGIATANLKLNKADAQTIGFSIATVTTQATNTLTITPSAGTAATMTVSQNITAPASNGGAFAQQPRITLKDVFGNICTGDNATVVTASKEDAGTWTLTGTATAAAISGVATFTNLGATNTALVDNAQLGFTATGLTTVTSSAVTLPAPSSSGSGGNSSNPPAQTSPEPVIVIVNGQEQDAGKETTTTENGKTTVTVEVDNKVIESKIDEAIQNNTNGTGNTIQVPISDTKSEVAKVELTGDIIKKLEENTFDVSVKRDNIEYVIPAGEFTISKVADNLGVLEKDLKEIKVEVQIVKLDEKVVQKYNEAAKANGAELVFPPVSFEVVAKTTKADGTTGEVAISKFSNYVERVMEIPAGIDPSKITTGIVFNPDGTYSHVPTDVYQKDGKWYAKLNSLTNSNYSVVWNPITVKSVEKHWSKDAVNDMASRLIIFNPESFDPNKSITRADFAEYIIRALGLYREGSTHENKFKDVNPAGDRTLAILIANEYGIVTGYSDGSFKPDAQITREEAMTMYARAMKVTKLTGIDKERYKNYTDYEKVSDWSAIYVKEVLAAHVFNGTTATTVSPKSKLTYAESAQAIKNLLVESELINK